MAGTKRKAGKAEPKPSPDAQGDTEKTQDRLAREKTASAWQKRLKRAMEAQAPWLAEGREMRTFIEGSQWNAEADQLLPDSRYSKTTANRMSALVQGILSTTVYQRPTVTAKPVRKGEHAVHVANVNQGYLRYCMRENRFEEHQYLATYDAVVFGAGATEEDVDHERGNIARSQWRSIEDVLVDPDANTLPESCGWMAVRFTMNVNTARRIYNAPDLQPDKQDQKPGSTGKASNHVGGGADDERVTLYRIWSRGDSPDLADADLRRKDNQVEGEAGQKPPKDDADLDAWLRRHGNRRLVVSLTYGETLDERPWPFVLDHDAFPVTIWTLHRVPGRLLPYSPLKPVKELQRQLNWALCFIITQMRRISQKKFAVDKSSFDGELHSELEKLTSLESEEVIMTSGNLANALREIDLGSLSDAPLRCLDILQQQFDEISGYRELFGGMSNSRSAYEARVRDSRAQASTSLQLQCVEAAMGQVQRKMLQIGFSVTSAQTVADILGPDEVGMAVDQLTGKPIDIAAYWDESRDAQRIRREVDTVLEPGSTRKVNAEQTVQDLINFQDRALGLMAQFANLGMRPDPVRLLNYINYFLRKAADTLGWQDMEQVLIPGEAIGIVEEPQPAPSNTVNIKQGNRNVTLQDARTFEDARVLDLPNPALTIHNKPASPAAGVA